MARAAVVFFAVVATACGPGTSVRRTSGAFPPRPGGCDYRVFEGWTARPYFVIGRVDVDAFHRGRLPSSEAELRHALGDRVCEAGADGLLAIRDITGRFVQGVLVSFLRPDPTMPCRAPPSIDGPTKAADGALAEPAAESPPPPVAPPVTAPGPRPAEAPPARAPGRGLAE